MRLFQSLPRAVGQSHMKKHMAGSSAAAILRDARLRRALRMRDAYAAAFQRRWMQLSLILRRPRSGRLEGRGARSGAAETITANTKADLPSRLAQFSPTCT